MTDMQQILAGMNELNKRVQNAEARATEAERETQASQQELARSQAGVKGRGRVQQCHHNRSRRPSAVRRRGRQVERLGELFAVGLDDFFGGALTEILRTRGRTP